MQPVNDLFKIIFKMKLYLRQAFFSQLLKLRTYCKDLLFYSCDLSSAVRKICFFYQLHLFIHPSRVYYELTYDQLPVGLIAQLVEHCTGIAEVMGSNQVTAYFFFFQDFFSQLHKLRTYCEDLSST